MSSSTERRRWARAGGAAVLAALQLVGLWAFGTQTGRDAVLERPETATLLRWRPDATGIVEFHGDQAFALSGERGLETIRLAADTIVLANAEPATPVALRPGSTVSVWGRPGAPRETIARVIVVWVPPA